MRLFCISLFLIILISSFAFAAVIKGTIYGPDLDIAGNVIVKINTKPAQQIIAKNGSYSFNVPIGNYELQAYSLEKEKEQYYFSEDIVVKNDGEYIIDILLYPKFGEDILPYPEDDLKIADINIEKEGNNLFVLVIITFSIIFLIVIILLFFKYHRNSGRISRMPKIENSNQKKQHSGFHKFHPEFSIFVHKKNISKENIPDDEYYNKIYDLIIKNKRITQKEIVKETPLSEAKISLILTDMESKGIIRKIKKGRANIIILNR